MHKISRIPPGARTTVALQGATDRVAASNDPKQTCKELWDGLSSTVRREIQQTLKAMCNGHERCMYCEDSAGTDIEHYWPKSTYPLKAFLWENYLWACAGCNSNHKRNKFPLDSSGNPLLLDPSVDDPSDHLTLTPSTGRYEGRDDRGVQTIDVCALNRDVCSNGRRDAWITLSHLLPRYAWLMRKDKRKQAEILLEAIKRYPFQSVRIQMVRIWERGSASSLLLPEDVTSAFTTYPELRE